MKKISFKVVRISTLSFAGLLFIGSLSNCRKFIEVDAPYSSINAENVFSTDATATAVVTDIYAQMIQDNQGGLSGLNNSGEISNLVLPTGLSSDELKIFDLGANTFQTSCYKNTLSAISSFPNFWTTHYKYIFKVNDVIQGITSNTSISSIVQKQLLGEARFLRAFYYMNLVNLYGDVPLAITTDYNENTKMQRTPKAQVYEQIISDLIVSQSLLSENYRAGNIVTNTTERVRPTKWAATALLARVCLYTGKYQMAIEESSKVIEKTDLFKLDELDKVFLKNRKESIWQLQPINIGGNTGEATTFKLTFIGPDAGLGQNVYLSDYIYDSFEIDDLRVKEWIGTVTTQAGKTYHFPYKYKVGRENNSTNFSEYLVVLRLAEQYLIRAEAKAFLNDFEGAKNDLNAIRHRAGLLNTTVASNQQDVLRAVLQERKVELFTEWGHRWFDLKRWPGNTLSTVMTPVCQKKGGTWNDNWALYPIPRTELDINRNLVQNAGY